jgi:hypothetical protein
MYELTRKIDFGNCTNILDIEREYKVSTSAGLANFKKVLMGYPLPDHLYRLIWIDGQYCAIDEELADLIQFLNDNDFPTKYCCAGHRTKCHGEEECQCYISFNHDSDRVLRLLSSVFKEITGESMDVYHQFSNIRIYSNKRYQEHSEQHVNFLDSSRHRKEIVLNKRSSFYTWMSFEGETIIRFNYKAERRMEALLRFKEMLMRIGQTL